MPKILNVEADEICYRMAFAAEKQQHYIITSSGKRGKFNNRYSKTDIINMLKARGKVLDVDYKIESQTIVEPVENCLRLIKNKLKELRHYGDLQLWLSPEDKSNFRYAVAKTQPYKGNRGRKPEHLKAAREYVEKYWGAQQACGYEADDMLGIYQTDNSVCVSIDKDLLQVEGKHLNWITGERYIVEPGVRNSRIENKKLVVDGIAWFYHQMLLGDRTDNIQGIAGMGDVKTHEALKDCSTELEYAETVSAIYINKYGESKQDFQNKLFEAADLLYICRSPGEYGSTYLKRILG